MQINAISSIMGVSGMPAIKPPASVSGEGFGQILTDAVNDLNESQLRADDLVQQLATGGDVELHDVMIAQEQADLSFQLAIQVRNKVLEAYQEIMRMQI
jgi:flagellar hook-basal body complex protein FliE